MTENHGVTSREPGPSDAGGVIVTVTSKGRNTLPRALAAVRPVEKRALAGRPKRDGNPPEFKGLQM